MADLKDGESIEVKGSGAKPYLLLNSGGVYSCTCPAWRNQSLPISQRTCKHLKKLRGDEAESRRIGNQTVSASGPKLTDRPEPEGKRGLLLASTWDGMLDPSGWWMSEKLDGIRALWDGNCLTSRMGNEFAAPDWFIERLPKIALDGELWLGRGLFQETISVVRSRSRGDGWKQVRFLVFDAPDISDVWEKRLRTLKEMLPKRAKLKTTVSLLEQIQCRGIDHVREELKRIEELGGEGLMLRQPGSRYESGRFGMLLKVKSFLDAEATVVGHQFGKGKHAGRLGALLVELADGTRFSLGTGFSDQQRENPPPIGCLVTFRYQELSRAGVPRFPSFIRIAERQSPKTRGRK